MLIVAISTSWATETTVDFVSSTKDDSGNSLAALANGDNVMVGSGLAKLIATNSCSLSTSSNKYGYRSDGGRLCIVFKFNGATTLTIKHNANSTGERYMQLYAFSSDKALKDITSSDWSTKTIQSFTSTNTSTTWGSGQASVVTTNAGKTTWNYTTKGCLTVTWENLPAGYYVLIGTGSEAYTYSFTADVASATKYTVSFNAGAHGTYTGGDITEASAGAGVTLPALTTLADGYIFNGWYTASTGGTKAGDAGDNYKPSADNTPLYAQYSEIPTPTFVLSASSIEVGQTAQIKVTGKDDLDGVTLSDISYGTSGVVTVNATTGVVTPVAAGSTTITFNSSAVDGKYKASSGNLSITVTAPKCATPTISPVSFSTDNQEVTITSETAGATIYYTTNGATPSTNSLVYDSENKPTISSTTTFKAIAVKENYDDSEVATQKITRTSSAVVASWDFTNWSSATQAGVRADGTNWRDYETSTEDKPLNDKVYSNKVANSTFVYGETTIPETEGLSFKNTAYTFGLAFDQASTTIGTYHGSQYLWLYGSNSTITIPSLSAGSTIEIGLESHKINGTDDATRKLTVTNTNEGSYSTETYTEQTFNVTADGNVTITPSKGMHVYYIKVTDNAETVPVATVGSNNYATYVTENNLDFSTVSDEITAYIATGDNGTTITTEAVTEVPAGTALLIKTANAGATVNVPVAASTPAALTANKLKYSSESLVISNDAATAKRYYGFFKVGGKYGFAPMKAGTLAAKKAYLDYGEQGNSLQFIALDFDDAPTAINAVEAANANNVAPVKVIKNGQLFIGNYNVAGAQVK